MNSSELIRKRHLSRRMFAIIDLQLRVASPNNPDSHIDWFVKEGWMTGHDDPAFERIVRGIVNDVGDVYFYQGADFGPVALQSIVNCLPAIVKQLAVKPDARVGNGLIPQSAGGQWPAQTVLGTVQSVLTAASARR